MMYAEHKRPDQPTWLRAERYLPPPPDPLGPKLLRLNPPGGRKTPLLELLVLELGSDCE